MSPKPEQEARQTTGEALLGTDLEQNAQRLYQEGKKILSESEKFNRAQKLIDERAIRLRQSIEVKGNKSIYLIFIGTDSLFITKRSILDKNNHYSTLFIELPNSKAEEAAFYYTTYIEGDVEKGNFYSNTQTAVQKAEEFLKALKQDLP